MRLNELGTQPRPIATDRAPQPEATRAQNVAGPIPVTPGQPDKAYDGHLLGAGGQVYPVGTNPGAIPPVRPSDPNAKPTQTLIFVNGMGESRESTMRRLQTIANSTGQNAVGVYNATEGAVRDLLQAVGDKVNLGRNPSVDSLADTIHSRLMAGEDVRLLAHSQGGIITERALGDVKNRLMLENGMSKPDAEALLGKVQVQTIGGAGKNFVDGPRYTHYVNRSDLVPIAFGVGSPGARPGKDADVVKFGWTNPFKLVGKSHELETYFKHWVPFRA